MKAKHFFILLYMAVFIALQSCSPYQKLLKSNDLNLKYQKAEEYFSKGDYDKALPLLEDLLSYYRGTAQAEKIYYLLSYTYYKMGDYTLAAYQFKNFAEAFPLSAYAEESFFLYAHSLYLDSPIKNLDQGNTTTAINAFKLFVGLYPESPKVEESNRYIDLLTIKLEEKAIENALLYYKIRDYKAAVWGIRNVLNQYPATKQREKLEYYMIKASYLLSVNSVETKQAERFGSTVQYYSEFKERYPKSQYDAELQRIYKDANSSLEKLKKKKA